MQGIFAGTFLIGLREGLEATLIVSIVGAFLRRNGSSLRPMFVGVAAAVLVSVAVGVGLDVLSTELPQRQQELLETVVGVVAVGFVTTMIIWMNRNAMHLKGELEGEAARAIDRGGTTALAVMAFLAVLKEGFETAVFLLAAAQATHGSRWAAVAGAVVGIAVAVGIGVGIFFGGLKVNLGRFFRITGVFLVLIAAGLVLSTLRTAHEAGLIDVGQRQVFELSAWLPARSIRGVLVTGMFGIPSDPRLIEVLGWLLYAVPVLAVFLWPRALTPSPGARRRVLVVGAAALTAAALVLSLVVPSGAATPTTVRATARADGAASRVALGVQGANRTLTVGDAPPVTLAPAGVGAVDGVPVDVWQASAAVDPGVHTAQATLGQLAELTGGRLPVGLGTSRTPGPFAVTWQATAFYTVATHDDSLVSARAEHNRIAVLSGGGIAGSKTVSLGGTDADWATTGDDAVTAAVSAADADRADGVLWRRWLPGLLLLGAVVTAVYAVRSHERSTPTTEERTPNEPIDVS